MKKTAKQRIKITFALAFALLFALVGCASQPGDASSSAASASSASLSVDASSQGSNQAESSDANNQTEPVLSIGASTYSLYDFAVRIGGQRVAVQELLPAGADAHNWEPSPQQLVTLSQHDIILINGVMLETWMDAVSSTLPNTVKVVDTSKDVPLLKFADEVDATATDDHAHAGEDHDHDGDGTQDHAPDAHDHGAEDHDHAHAGEDHDHDNDGTQDHAPDAHDHATDAHAGHDHVHGEYDPHYWLSIEAVKLQAKNVLETLQSADPDGKDEYQKNFDLLLVDLNQLQSEYTAALQGAKGKSIIVPHEAFGYLAKEYGLVQYGIEGAFAEGEPNTAKMRQIIDFARENNVSVIFFEPNDGDKVSKQIAGELGIKTLPLRTLEVRSAEDEKAGTGYVESMRKNLESLVESFSAN